MSKDLKWMLSSDQQIPFQDDRAIDLWFQVMDWYKPDVVDFLGDTSDQFCFSSYSEGTTTEFLKQIGKEMPVGVGNDLLGLTIKEEKLTAEFYAKNRERAGKDADMFSALGNHDIRVWRYADKKMPEQLEHITPEALWGLDNLGIDYIYYEDKPKHRYGDIYVHHGISAVAEAGASVKTDIGNLGVSLIRGHSHRMGSYFKTYELRNEILRGYEIGHMCKVDSDGFKYSQIHNWQQGFAVGLISGNDVHIQLVEINPNYECWVAGKLFKA